jgi:poly(hydroxyalkanoate) depolymerase family esterase
MAGLGETAAKLRHYRRQFEAAAGGAAGHVGATARHAALKDWADFGSNPGNLRMLSYRPEHCPDGAPLVVVLHGCTQTASGYAEGAGWMALAERHGFVLLLPEQQRANNANLCFNWFLPEDIGRDGGEAASIRQMVERLAVHESIDRARIFVTGLSAGGAMAAVMLAAYPDVFAGGAVVAGLPYGVAGSVQDALQSMFQGKSLSAKEWGGRVRAASRHKGPWPRISIWHGGADQTVQPSNQAELVKQWTDLHGLPARPTSDAQAGGHRLQSWAGPDGEALVEAHTIAGMAHGAAIAPGGADGVGVAGPFLLDVGIASSERIAAFWGIAEAAQADRSPRPSKSPAPASQSDRTRAPASDTREKALAEPGGRFDPQSVITAALRKAGLMKD